MTKSMKYILGLLLLCSVFSGCKTRTVYVPTERTKIEYRDRYTLDSVFYRDTVQLSSRNDTVFRDVIKWRERFKIVKDTVNLTDSIPVIVEVEVPVNYLTKWQKIRLQILNMIGALVAVYVAYSIGRKKWF